MADLSILVLADDLTGALEVGAKFADRGVPAPVICRSSVEPSCHEGPGRLCVLDMETRHLTPAEAAEAVRSLACHARDHKVDFLYKKTDSTLRGNIGSELQALLSAFPGEPLVYAPAYPRLGRTVKDGILFVDGVPVSRTRFASDPLEPVRESNIRILLEDAGCPVAGLVRSVREIGAGC
ncbi:MAG: four-carbon acid sugar kinase family protein, partial [Acidobacteria bacterium]|nr:four-carbon acid sugar kinase family protein [Acidobacteriota bacterium]